MDRKEWSHLELLQKYKNLSTPEPGRHKRNIFDKSFLFFCRKVSSLHAIVDKYRVFIEFCCTHLGREGIGRESFVEEKKVQEIQRLKQKTAEDMEMFRLRKKQQFSDKRDQRDFRKSQLACEDLDNKMVQ